MRRQFGMAFVGIAFAASAATGGAGCYWGPKAENFGPANTPSGLVGTFQTPATSMRAELLAVVDTGMIVRRMDGGTVMFVSNSRLTYAMFEGANTKYEIGAGARDAEMRRRIQLLSRYPQGLNATLLSAVLRASNQTAVENVP